MSWGNGEGKSNSRQQGQRWLIKIKSKKKANLNQLEMIDRWSWSVNLNKSWIWSTVLRLVLKIVILKIQKAATDWLRPINKRMKKMGKKVWCLIITLSLTSWRRVISELLLSINSLEIKMENIMCRGGSLKCPRDCNNNNQKRRKEKNQLYC